MKLFVLSFDFHSFFKKGIPDVIQISTFVHFSLVVKLKASCKQMQHCWPTTPNIVGSCCICLHVAKSLTGCKLSTTSPNNITCNEGVQTDATCNIGQQCSSFCRGLTVNMAVKVMIAI